MFCRTKKGLLEKYIEEADKVYFQIDVSDEHVKKIEKQRLTTGLALNRRLEEFRELVQ